MIDYITAKFPFQHNREDIHLFRGKYLTARLKNNSTTIEVKSVGNGRFLVVSGNPVKYLQGHNIFGSNDLRGLCRDLLVLVSAQLGIKLNYRDQQSINLGDYSLSRVDLAVNFRLPRCETVSHIVREIEWHWRELGYNVSNYTNETVYRDQHSKVEAAKFYNKSKELRAHPLPENILGNYVCNRLRQYAEGLLRAEFTLRSPALKRLGMASGSEWTVEKSKSLILEKLASQSLDFEIKHSVLPEVYNRWEPALKQIYCLWLQGNDLHYLFGERTLYRKYKSLAAFGINILCPPVVKRRPMIPIRALVNSDNITWLPRFAKRLGLVHLPPKTNK